MAIAALPVPRPTTAPTAWVDAAPFRAHAMRLCELSALPWRAVAIAARVPTRQLEVLLFGRDGRQVRRISPLIAARLLRVEVADLFAAATLHVDATDVSREVRWLLAHDQDAERLARYARVPAGVLDQLAADELRQCSRLTRLLIGAAYDAVRQAVDDKTAEESVIDAEQRAA